MTETPITGEPACRVEFVSDRGGPTLTCDRPARFHLLHHDPATGARYARSLRRIYCFRGTLRHRRSCPLRRVRKGGSK